jgi:hypothetical protein
MEVSAFKTKDFFSTSRRLSSGRGKSLTGPELQPERKKITKRPIFRIFFTLPPSALIIYQFYTI